MQLIEQEATQYTPNVTLITPQGSAEIDARFADPLIIQLRADWRTCQDLTRAETKLTLQVKAICRRFCDGEIKEADKLYKSMQNGMQHPYAEDCLIRCSALLKARQPLQTEKKYFEKQLETAAKRLPVTAFVESVKGFGYKGLAQIVAECGNLAEYEKGLDGIMKRAGLALVDGERQRKSTNVEKALAMGYSPQRRSVFYNIGDALLKSQGKEENAGPYRKIYDLRKAYERPNVDSDGHAHNRAMRYMTKRLVRDLHKHWLEVA